VTKPPLEPNMTFHMILGMWMDDWGFECSEAFMVTKTGCENICEFSPEKLFIKKLNCCSVVRGIYILEPYMIIRQLSIIPQL